MGLPRIERAGEDFTTATTALRFGSLKASTLGYLNQSTSGYGDVHLTVLANRPTM